MLNIINIIVIIIICPAATSISLTKGASHLSELAGRTGASVKLIERGSSENWENWF